MLSNFKEIFAIKELRRLVLTSLIVRVFVLLWLPSTPSIFGPDEGTYGSLARWVSEGKDVTNFPAFGAGLYNTSRSLILPAALLCKIGMDELSAVRITALVYGFTSIIAFLMLMIRFIPMHKRNENQKFRKLFFILAFVYLFLPSHLLWSVLGLRESALDFWLILSFLLLIEVQSRTAFTRRSLILMLLLIISIAFTFGARRESAAVFLISEIGRAHV